MLSAAVLLLLTGAFYTLRLSINTGSFPKTLSAEEERHYLNLASQGDLEARNVLVERNLRLVAHIMKKYYTNSADQDDLISIGTIGLIKGISSFDGSKGARLATYAARCIENEILMYFRGQKKMAGDVSLSDMIESSRDGNALSFMDVLCSDEDLFEDISTKEQCVLVRSYVDRCLDERERRIISLRYGLDGQQPMTQREVAVLMGFSRSYISRIEKKALGKLEYALSGA